MLGGPHVTVQNGERVAPVSEVLGQQIEVITAFRQHDRMTALGRKLERVRGDHLGATPDATVIPVAAPRREGAQLTARERAALRWGT